MAITFPTTLDSLTNPTSGNTLNSPPHATQHADANDAIEALEAKVGVNSSAVTTSHDYKLGEILTTDKAVGKTATQTLSAKTLTSPVINLGSNATGDTYYRDSGGLFQRLPIGTAGQILNVSASSIPEWIANPSASDASTTVKGVVEEATLAEMLARTAAGGTSARLFVNPSTLTTVQTYDYVADTGSATAYAIAPTPAITAYVTGQKFLWKAINANTTTTPTLAVSGLASPKTIINADGTALAVGQISANTTIQTVYDGTNMLLLSSAKIPMEQLISTVTISQAVTSGNTTKIAEFTGLTGNTADEYFIDFETSNPSIDNTGFFYLRFNDDSTTNAYGYNITPNSGTTALNTSPASHPLTSLATQIPTVCFGTIRIKASRTIAGTSRAIISDVCSGNGVATIGNARHTGVWTDTTNEITSIQIYLQQTSGGSVTSAGKASLYKINR